MRRIGAAFLSLFVCTILLCADTECVRAQDGWSSLYVCNRSRVPVEVVVANTVWDGSDLARGSVFQGHWEIEGLHFKPGLCWQAYNGQGSRQEVFIGFGFKDSRGRFISGTVRQVPDWGTVMADTMFGRMVDAAQGQATHKALSHASRSVCVHADETEYASNDDKFPTNTNCADFSIGGGKQAGSGPFYPLTLALDFFPEQGECHSSAMPGQWPSCGGGDYRMNILANPATGEVQVTTGLRDGSDAPPVEENAEITALENKMKQQFAAAVLKAMDEQEKRKAEEAAAADPIARADAARKVFEERQSHIDYKSEHERNLGRIREVAQFSPEWLRSTGPLYVRGTVSRVELPVRRRPWATFYFNESPDGAFAACVFAALFDDLQHYVGQRVEVRGRISRGECGAQVADVLVGNPAMVYELAKGTPPDEEILPGMKESPGGGVSSMAAIPINTDLRVTLSNDVDLAHASEGQTFAGSLAAPVRLPDGGIPAGAAVVLVHTRYRNLQLASVTADGKIWRVGGKADDLDDNASFVRAGTTLVFGVAGANPPVPVARTSTVMAGGTRK